MLKQRFSTYIKKFRVVLSQLLTIISVYLVQNKYYLPKMMSFLCFLQSCNVNLRIFSLNLYPNPERPSRDTCTFDFLGGLTAHRLLTVVGGGEGVISDVFAFAP